MMLYPGHLWAQVTPGLSSECNVYVSSRAAFTVEFCGAADTSAACAGPGGRSVDFTGQGRGVVTTQTNFTDIGDGVILQREIVVNGGGEGGAGASSAEIEKSSSSSGSVWTDYVLPSVLGVLIALVLLLLVTLGCCWWQGCLGWDMFGRVRYLH